MVSRSTVLRNLAKGAFVEMNDEDAKELDVSEGDEVTVTAGDASVTAAVVIGDISKGAVFVPYDQKGLHANELLGAGGRVQVTKS